MTEALNDILHGMDRLVVLRDVEGRTSFSHPFAAQPAGENRSVAIRNHEQNSLSKYMGWYNELILSRQRVVCTSPYSEVHHIVPRSLGGGDEEPNLVRLTYREHFIAHWLLTKFHSGRDRSKMQRALFAMTMQISGRLVAGWQFEVAKRAVKDLHISLGWKTAIERAELQARELFLRQNAKAFAARERELESLSNSFLKDNENIESVEGGRVRPTRRRHRSRPGKRARLAAKVA